ncbi:MAG: flagellar protein export ATPase FliI [Acidobacteriaceae bacterium]|nr:flagellar protein export ATPase FliI [Acidobacteriaceae bacterium]
MTHDSVVERVQFCRASIEAIPRLTVQGRVVGLSSQILEISGVSHFLSIGDPVSLETRDRDVIDAEVVGFRGGLTQVMPFTALRKLGPGSTARITPGRQHGLCLPITGGWVGRVIDPLGRPLDERGAMPSGPFRSVSATPPLATSRARLGRRIDLGIRALNTFATCRQGQRLGLFAGSGVGKSTLLSMLARFAAAELIVLALIGERGREVREFLEDDLGPEGVARSVTVVATSDATPLMRRQAAWTAMTVAEYFRDEGKSVLLLMDSITRFCMALREIGLSAGEPPATRGYPPSVFAELPRLLERAGPGRERPDGRAGYITGLFTVLVEGDDYNEPIADAVRGILDGHVTLDRRIGEAGRYPAIDVLRSLSRTAAMCNDREDNATVKRARAILALHTEMADLVRLGAYKAGADPSIDEAIAVAPRINSFLQQNRDERSSIEQDFRGLAAVLSQGTT